MKIVAVSGSLRAQSSNGALLRALATIAPAGVDIETYTRLGDLPHFNPDLDFEGGAAPDPVAATRALLIAADGVVISSPEYAHGVPGSLKNMLDWLVSVGTLEGKPVMLVNASPAGGLHAQRALLETLRTMNWRVVEEACLVEPFVRTRIRDELSDAAALDALRAALARFVAAIGG